MKGRLEKSSRSIFLSPTIVEKEKIKYSSTKPEGVLNFIIRSLFKSREFNRANYGEITDCYSFSPKQWHNLSLIFSSFSPFIIFSHRSDFFSSKIHLWDSVSKLRAYNKNSLDEYCNVRCHALLQD